MSTKALPLKLTAPRCKECGSEAFWCYTDGTLECAECKAPGPKNTYKVPLGAEEWARGEIAMHRRKASEFLDAGDTFMGNFHHVLANMIAVGLPKDSEPVEQGTILLDEVPVVLRGRNAERHVVPAKGVQ